VYFAEVADGSYLVDYTSAVLVNVTDSGPLNVSGSDITYVIQGVENPIEAPPAPVNYTLTLTMNNTNTSAAINSFCAGVGSPSSCTTNGTVVLTEQTNGSKTVSYTSSGMTSGTQGFTVAGDTVGVIQATPTTPATPTDNSDVSHVLLIVSLLLAIAFLMMAISQIPGVGGVMREHIGKIAILMGVIIIIALLLLL
jgi:hypothetical protein